MRCNLDQPRNEPGPPGARGDAQRPLPGRAFTLIEMIGILAILSILVTIIVSTTTNRLDFAAANLESTNLVNFATALQSSALRYRYIPGPVGGAGTNWVRMIATELGTSPFLVNTNARNSRRVLLIDPGNTLSLPYAQPGTGTGWRAAVRSSSVWRAMADGSRAAWFRSAITASGVRTSTLPPGGRAARAARLLRERLPAQFF